MLEVRPIDFTDLPTTTTATSQMNCMDFPWVQPVGKHLGEERIQRLEHFLDPLRR